MPSLRSNNTAAYSNLNKAESLADALMVECVNNAVQTEDKEHVRRVEVIASFVKRYNAEVTDPMLRQTTTPLEVATIIKTLKNRKAPKEDNITNIMVKNGDKTTWRLRFGAAILAPPSWRHAVLAPTRFGAKPFWRR